MTVLFSLADRCCSGLDACVGCMIEIDIDDWCDLLDLFESHPIEF